MMWATVGADQRWVYVDSDDVDGGSAVFRVRDWSVRESTIPERALDAAVQLAQEVWASHQSAEAQAEAQARRIGARVVGVQRLVESARDARLARAWGEPDPHARRRVPMEEAVRRMRPPDSLADL